jgi:hypothetical protein
MDAVVVSVVKRTLMCSSVTIAFASGAQSAETDDTSTYYNRKLGKRQRNQFLIFNSPLVPTGFNIIQRFYEDSWVILQSVIRIFHPHIRIPWSTR